MHNGLAPLDHAADESGLASVLEVAGGHADQPHAERDRQIPVIAHDQGEISVRQTRDKADRPLVDRVVLPDQQFG